MLDHYTESLLQEIATELAFLIPSRPQGLDRMAEVLSDLGQSESVLNLPEVQRDVAWSLELCQQANASQAGLAQEEMETLQLCFERLSNALYMVKSLTPSISSIPESPNLFGTDEPAQQPEPLHAPESDGADSVAEEGVVLLGPDADLDLLNEFCAEGRDMLVQVEQGVLVLEENPRHKDMLNQVFRAFHTFKGGAGFLGIEPVQQLAHQLESLLDAARRDQLSITKTVIELILSGGDALQQYVTAIARQLGGEGFGQPIHVPTADLHRRLEACLLGEPVADSSTPTLDLSVMPLTAAPVKAAATAPAAPTPVAPVPSVKASAPVPQAVTGETLANYVKLDTRKLDAMIDLMGELVIAQSMVVQHRLVREQRDRDFDRHLRQLSRITTDLQRNAMSLRMVPIRSTFQKMTRLVRDLAGIQNKQVQLHLSGEDTELDRNLVEELSDPLLHMMRNAVDHGIEPPAEREAAGKNPQGNVYLHAMHQGGGILIRMRDDGRGLDSKRILAKALQNGLVSADEVLTDKSIFNLIFLPGFSTAEKVTDISGRGVGMDVVRGNISRLRGRIDIFSTPGEGTIFEIFLPLTLAIIDGMLVGVGQERFILPTLAIRESLRPQPHMVSTVQGKGEVISVRDKLIPLVRLSEKLGIASELSDPCDGIVMVVDSGARTRALLVDSLIGKQEVVIKTLGETFQNQQGMSGAAILGDGRVALIIDPDAISQLPSQQAAST